VEKLVAPDQEALDGIDPEILVEGKSKTILKMGYIG
jgi:hypothetical protein